MIQKEVLKRILDNSYIFCFTRSMRTMDILYKFKARLSELNIRFNTISGDEEYSLILSHKDDQTNSPFIFINKLNDQGDYSAEQLLDIYPGADIVNRYDTLLSCSFHDKDKFVAYNDYMGIIRHYYYYDNESFFASNNSFLVALLSEVKINPEAIYETLFFRFPYKTGSFFDNVRILDPFEYIEYTVKNNELRIQSFKQPGGLYNYYPKSQEEGVYDFWSKVKHSRQKVRVSFSGGSDSMTVISLLDQFKIPYDLVSFEGHDKLDTRRNIKLAQWLGYNHLLLPAKSKEYSEQNRLEYTILSNGFFNSDHFYGFYKELENSTVFDGYAFFMGSWDDALISDMHMEALINKTHRITLNRHLNGIDTQYRNLLVDYIDEKYVFPEINSEDALTYIQEYGLDFICSKVYAGVLLPALYFKINNYSFFLSKKFFSPLMNINAGIASTFRGRDDFPGYIKNKKPLSLIVHQTGSEAYECVMDHGLSFKDIYSDDIFSTFKMKIYLKKNAIYHRVFKPSPNNHLFLSKNGTEMNFPTYVADETKLSPYLRERIVIINIVEDSLRKLKLSLHF
jgi:hypothetical protein